MWVQMVNDMSLSKLEALNQCLVGRLDNKCDPVPELLKVE